MKINNILSLLKSLFGISLLTCALAANLYGQTNPQQRIINEVLIKKIFMMLPDEVMPDVFQTTEKRSQAKPEITDNILKDNLAHYEEDYYYAEFTLAAFPYDDGENILLVMQQQNCFEGCILAVDKTLNYNIKSGKIISISRPINPFDADDFLSKKDLRDLKSGTKEKLKRWFNESADKEKILYEFTGNGIEVMFNYFGFNDDEFDYMFWSEYNNPTIKNAKVRYQWDGKRFVKVEESGEYSQATKSSVFAYDGFLLGASINGQWIDARQLQEKEIYASYKIKGGEQHRLYDVDGLTGTGTGSIIETNAGKYSAQNLQRTFDVSIRNGTMTGMNKMQLTFLGEKLTWEPVPRKPEALNVQNATYKKIVKDFLATWVEVDNPQIEQIYRVDLDGDGADEVIIYAQNRVSPKIYNDWWNVRLREEIANLSRQHAVNEAMDQAMNAAREKTGLYSLLLLRKIADGKVVETPLSLSFDLLGAYSHERIVQFADLNGDGKMEIIIGKTYNDEVYYQVVEVAKDGSAETVLNSNSWEDEGIWDEDDWDAFNKADNSAKVEFFAAGEGINLYLNMMRIDKYHCIAGTAGDMVFAVTPPPYGKVSLWKAITDANGRVTPDFKAPIYIPDNDGETLLFPYAITDGSPTVVVSLRLPNRSEHYWSSAYDDEIVDALATTDHFKTNTFDNELYRNYHAAISSLWTNLISFVQDFPNGKGLEQFINTYGNSKYLKATGMSGETTFFVKPPPTAKATLYKAVTDKEGKVVPDLNTPLLESNETGEAIIFPYTVPAGNPTVVVIVTTVDSRKLYWSPRYDSNGSLIVDDYFTDIKG